MKLFMNSDKKSRKYLPFIFYFIIALVIVLIGFSASTYLAVSHYRVYTDIDYNSFCAVSKTINCDTVSQSPYSIFLSIPVPIWGILGYCLLLVIMVQSWYARSQGKITLWPTLFFLSLMFSIFSIVLGSISTFFIKSYCIMCILTYAVNFFLVYFFWLIITRFYQGDIIGGFIKNCRYFRQRIKMVFAVAACYIVVIGLLSVCIPEYWVMSNKSLLSEIPNGITRDGHPWIGAIDPQLTIIEYADYQCFQCKKMHYYLRQLIAKYPTKLRLVHRHFPMDHAFNPIVVEPYHQGAGKLALLAIFSSLKGKFWIMNDVLYSLQQSTATIKIQSIADATGLNTKELVAAMQNTYLKKMLKADIINGIKYGVNGTPAYRINGKLHLGTLPVNLLTDLDKP